MQENQMNALINYFNHYNPQITLILFTLAVVVTTIFLWLWVSNKKKYEHINRQIPANVVKNYLDSIIQNSQSMKSSLFNEGGVDQMPSIFPMSQQTPSQNVGLAEQDAAAFRAQISRLESDLLNKNSVILDFENRVKSFDDSIAQRDHRIQELEDKILSLEKMLENASNQAPVSELDDETKEKLSKLTEIEAERDKYKEELGHYDVISDDLAELKNLKEENERLKAQLGGASAPVVEAKPEEPKPALEIEEPVSEETTDQEAKSEEVTADAASDEDMNEDQKALADEILGEVAAEIPQAKAKSDTEDEPSPDDLLSEFEKMLG